MPIKNKKDNKKSFRKYSSSCKWKSRLNLRKTIILQQYTISLDTIKNILQKGRRDMDTTIKMEKKLDVPIWHKSNLTLEEAAAYSGIGINKLRELTNEKGCKYVLFVGTKRLIKRQLLDEYINQLYSI